MAGRNYSGRTALTQDLATAERNLTQDLIKLATVNR